VFKGCMSSIAEATPIILTSEERTELESPARSTKTEYRARVKARIVLMAADGAATRRIARHLRRRRSDVLRLQEPRRRPQDNQG
jgi:hypothetical protein